jgi:hypothetical protein
MINWFKNQTMSVARSYAIELLYRFLVKRKSQGTLIAPCQTELRTLLIPSIVYFDKLFDIGFDNIVKNIGFQERFLYTDSKIRELPNTAKEGIPKIAQDSREKTELNFKNCEIIKTKLDFGDICGYGEFYSNVFIERKANISDFVQTISEFDRFNREIKRAKQLGAYLIVIVEEPLDKCLKFSDFFDKCQATPEYIFHNVRRLIRENENLQFCFLDKNKFEKIVLWILSVRENIQKIDIQYLLDSQKI